MISPKSRHKPPKRKSQPRRHTNKEFYNSKAWRQARETYLRSYQTRLYESVVKGYWISGDHKFILSPSQQTKILSMQRPCEICLRLFCAEAYDTMNEGKELDHIIPINPENAMESKDYGDPLDQNNYQWLCPRHHAKKSQREAKI